MLRLFSLAVCVLVFLGCSSARRGEPITGRPTPYGTELAKGRKIFFQNCHQCHPNGEAGLGPALNNKAAPRFLIKTQVRAGLGTMPAFSKDEITSEDLEELVDYLKALRYSK